MKQSCLTNAQIYENSTLSSLAGRGRKRDFLCMKQLLFAMFVPFLFFAACLDSDKPAINGMWQLKTIEDSTHTVQSVDTIFYAFQRQSIFSYTVLYRQEGFSIYGFIDFPDNDHLHIQLDKNYYLQAPNVLWKDTSIVYNIIRLDAKHLTLLQDGTFYYFNKY
jgi:hypothetical protein